MSPRDLRKELDAAADTPAQSFVHTWMPAPGDTLAGIIRVLDRVPSKFDSAANVLHVVLLNEEDHELWQIFANHIVLAQELAKASPAVGDRLGVKRLADLPDKQYKRYKVILERAPEPPDPEPDDDIDFAFTPRRPQ
jgi:hypothetical protein